MTTKQTGRLRVSCPIENRRAGSGFFARLFVVLVVSVLLKPSLAAEDAPSASEKKDREVAEAEIRKLLRDYTAARNDLAEKDAVVRRAVTQGASACQRLQPLLLKDVYRELNRYGAAFRKSALQLASGRLAQVNPAEVASLRQQFHALRENADLTEAMIKKNGDPVISRLESLLVIDRKDIFASNPKLEESRKQLEQIGAIWERCAFVSYEEFAKSEEGQAMPFQTERPSFQAFLEGEEAIEARMTIPMTPQDRAVLTANARLATRMDRSEARAILATNLLRIMVGQSPCAADLRLVAASRDHSNDMKRLNFFSHQSPAPGKREFTNRANNFQTTASAENIAIHGGGGPAVVRAWYLSPGHHKNIFGTHKRIGVGKADRYWTQMFGR